MEAPLWARPWGLWGRLPGGGQKPPQNIQDFLWNLHTLLHARGAGDRWKMRPVMEIVVGIVMGYQWGLVS